jgi:SAM-dependent methyltransferase
MPVLDIGCGTEKRGRAIGLDLFPLPGVDVVSDVRQGLPFRSEDFDVVECHQVIEHLEDCVPLMREIHRVLKPGGLLRISFPLPHRNTVWRDPTHKRPYTLESMRYFCRPHSHSYYFDFFFEWEGVTFTTGYRGRIKRVVEGILNRIPPLGFLAVRFQRLVPFSYCDPIVRMRKPRG